MDIHNISDHIRRNGLLSIIHEYVYGVKRAEIEDILSVCISALVGNAEGSLLLLVSAPRERYITDLVDYSSFEGSNDGV